MSWEDEITIDLIDEAGQRGEQRNSIVIGTYRQKQSVDIVIAILKSIYHCLTDISVNNPLLLNSDNPL